MNINIRFPGGKRVDAVFDGFVVHTDQSASHGGQGTAPEPYDVFLASIASCAGAYLLAFCQARDIPIAGIELSQEAHFDPATHRVASVQLKLVLPPTFPEKHRAGIVRAIEGCKVRKTLALPPSFGVGVHIRETAA